MFNYKNKPVRLEKPLSFRERFDKWVNKHNAMIMLIGRRMWAWFNAHSSILVITDFGSCLPSLTGAIFSNPRTYWYNLSLDVLQWQIFQLYISLLYVPWIYLILWVLRGMVHLPLSLMQFSGHHWYWWPCMLFGTSHRSPRSSLYRCNCVCRLMVYHHILQCWLGLSFRITYPFFVDLV